MSADPSRLSLLSAKLQALVTAQVGPGERASAPFPGGAGLVGGASAWVLVEGDPLKAFGPALVWAARQGASDVHLLVEEHADVLARRATCFAPAPSVWRIDGRSLAAALPAPPSVPVPAPSAPALAELLVDADLEVVVEEGIVRGEVRGLEVARVVHGASTSGMPLDEPILEVGVGHADRELTAMLHGALSPLDQLSRVVGIVRQQRRAGAERHPLNQLAPERWLRALLLEDPARIGLRRLHAVEPAVARPNLRDTAVAMAAGETEAGAPVVVACSVGVDLDLVPAAADTRLSVDAGAGLVLVVPERDAHPVTRELAGRLVHPAELVTVEDDWRT
jgi:hypothetical protein